MWRCRWKNEESNKKRYPEFGSSQGFVTAPFRVAFTVTGRSRVIAQISHSIVVVIEGGRELSFSDLDPN
jgi:hypothetical protein